MYALHIKPKVSLGCDAGRMLQHKDSGNMFHLWACQECLPSTQSHDVQPACLSLNGSLVYNKAVPAWDGVRDAAAAPHGTGHSGLEMTLGAHCTDSCSH